MGSETSEASPLVELEEGENLGEGHMWSLIPAISMTFSRRRHEFRIRLGSEKATRPGKGVFQRVALKILYLWEGLEGKGKFEVEQEWTLLRSPHKLEFPSTSTFA